MTWQIRIVPDASPGQLMVVHGVPAGLGVGRADMRDRAAAPDVVGLVVAVPKVAMAVAARRVPHLVPGVVAVRPDRVTVIGTPAAIEAPARPVRRTVVSQVVPRGEMTV